MIAALLLAAQVRPWCLEDEADQACTEDQLDYEIGLRTLLLDDDPLTAYNLTVALRDAGYPVEPWLREVAARCAPWDPTYTATLLMLYEESTDKDERHHLALELGIEEGDRHGVATEENGQEEGEPASPPSAEDQAHQGDRG